MDVRGVAVVMVLFVGCTAEPVPTGQLPEFTLVSSTPSLGSLEFSVSKEGYVEGNVTLDAASTSSGPLLVAVVWLEAPWDTITYPDPVKGNPLLISQGQQLVGILDNVPGTQSFSARLRAAPLEAMRLQTMACPTGKAGRAEAALVAFIDENNSGTLDLTQSPAADHVLTSSEFPFVLVNRQVDRTVISFGEVCSQTGFLEVQGTLPLVDVPLLDLVCCLRSDRYFQPEVCGTAASRAPVMSFFGQRNDESAKIFVTPPSKVTVLVDGTPRGEGNPSTAFSFVDASLGTGQHHVRAEQEDGGVWEATFTLPDRIWFRATRRDGDAMEVYFQEPPGATTYRLSSGSLTVDGTASPLRFPITRELSLIARFGKLPFSATATATLPP